MNNFRLWSCVPFSRIFGCKLYSDDVIFVIILDGSKGFTIRVVFKVLWLWVFRFRRRNRKSQHHTFLVEWIHYTEHASERYNREIIKRILPAGYSNYFTDLLLSGHQVELYNQNGIVSRKKNNLCNCYNSWLHDYFLRRLDKRHINSTANHIKRETNCKKGLLHQRFQEGRRFAGSYDETNEVFNVYIII